METSGNEKEQNENDEILCGLSKAELNLIHRLAGNDPKVRKETMRKLKKWLRVLAFKSPDKIGDCKEELGGNFMRVWKALFYCMWHADKPLPQEQLATSISNLLEVFKEKPHSLMLFIEWFFLTIAREWSWIDKFRLDKFMMMIRRFLRKIFMELSEQNFKVDLIDQFNKILSNYLFNHHPNASCQKTRAKVRSDMPMSPLGFQIHIIDIYLEELAKVAGDDLSSKQLFRFLSPFINEMAMNNDERLVGEIKERIFHHLMRQSEAALDYEDKLIEKKMEKAGMVFVENGHAEEEEDMELDEMAVDEPKDPRAGAMDVVLPQLNVDFAQLATILMNSTRTKSALTRNKPLLFSLARKCEEIAKGKYPMEAPDDDDLTGKPIKKKDVNQALENLLVTQPEKAIRKTKKQRKRERKNLLNANRDSFTSEEDEGNSQYLNDDDLLDHVTDNYMSYLEEAVGGDEAEEEEEIQIEKDSDEKIESNGFNYEEEDPAINEIDLTESDDDDLDKNDDVSPATNHHDSVILIRRKKKPKAKSPKMDKNTKDTLKKIKKNSLKKSMSPKNSPLTIPKTKSLLSPKTPKTPGRNGIGSGSGSGLKKRVSFVLARNLEHEHADYQQSIVRSPASPFEALQKTPKFGLLKQRTKSKLAEMFNMPRKRLI